MFEIYKSPGARSSMLMVLPALLLVGVLFLLPISSLVALSFDWSGRGLRHYETLLGTATFLDALLTTLRVSFFVVLGCVFFGLPIGYLMANCSPRLRPIVALAVLLPFWTSILVRNFAWIFLLQRRGVVNNALTSLGVVDQPIPFMFNEFGVVLGMTNALLPFMVLPIFVAFQAQDRALLEASSSLGARPEASFLWITLPLCVPGIVAGSLLVFATALGFFVTPALLGGGKVHVAATFITNQVETFFDWNLASAASTLLLLAVLPVIAAYMRIVRLDKLAGAGDAAA